MHIWFANGGFYAGAAERESGGSKGPIALWIPRFRKNLQTGLAKTLVRECLGTFFATGNDRSPFETEPVDRTNDEEYNQ
jgi:hypothetical protein